VEVDGGYTLWDATSSGLTEVWDIPTPNRNRRSPVIAELNFGVLDVEPVTEGEDDLRLRLALCDVNGKARVTKELTLSSLRFGPGAPAKEKTA